MEYAGDASRLELVLPGAVQVRQQALWHWLRRTESLRTLFPGHSPAVDIVSVREALRSAVAPELSAQLGKTLQEGARLTRMPHVLAGSRPSAGGCAAHWLAPCRWKGTGCRADACLCGDSELGMIVCHVQVLGASM